MKRNMLLFLQYAAISAVVMVIVYPILHEFGHVAATICVGGKVIGATFLPVPSVLCRFTNENRAQVAWITLSGILFPAAIFIVFPIGRKSRTSIKKSCREA